MITCGSMKKILAFLGILAIFSTVAPEQLLAISTSNGYGFGEMQNSTLTSKDKYKIAYKTDYDTSQSNLKFTLDGVEYDISLSDTGISYGSVPEHLLLCSIEDTLGKEMKAIHSDFIASLAKTFSFNLYSMMRSDRTADCVKDNEGIYVTMYTASTSKYTVDYLTGNPDASTFVIKSKDGSEKHSIDVSSPSMELVTCALQHEKNVSYAELDTDLFFVISDALSADTLGLYGGHTQQAKSYYFVETSVDDCAKSKDGVYISQYKVSVGDYDVIESQEELHWQYESHIEIKNNKNGLTKEYVVTYPDLMLCGAERVMGTSFQDMDSDLREALAQFSYVDVNMLEEYGSTFLIPCTKDEDGKFVIDDDRIKAHVSQAITVYEKKLKESEKIYKTLNQYEKSYVQYSVVEGRGILKTARTLYKDGEYASALNELRYGLSMLYEVKEARMYEEADTTYYMAGVEMGKLYFDIYKHDALQKNEEQVEELDNLYEALEKAYMVDRNYEESIRLAQQLMTKIEALQSSL